MNIRGLFENALYYPHIDIHNDRWLKSAALFWDRIETIVLELQSNIKEQGLHTNRGNVLIYFLSLILSIGRNTELNKYNNGR